MVVLPDDIIFIIYNYSFNNNIILIDKGYYNYITEIKRSFKNSLIKQPLIINYTITQWGDNIFESNSFPSMKNMKRESYKLINQSDLNNILVINNNTIEFTVPFNQYLTQKESANSTGANMFDLFGNVNYWTIRNITSDDERFYYYLLLFTKK